MRVSWHQSVFLRLLLAFVTVIVLACSVAASIAIFTEKTVFEDLVRADLRVRAETTLHDVEHYLEDREHELRSWGALPIFDEILVGDRSMHVQNSLLTLGRRRAAEYSALAALDRDRNVVASTGPWPPVTFEGYPVQIETRVDEVTWTLADLAVGASGTHRSLFVAVPITSRLKTGPIGWLVGEIDWDRIEEIVRGAQIGGRPQDGSRFLVLVDGDGGGLAGLTEHHDSLGPHEDVRWTPTEDGGAVDVRETRRGPFLATRVAEVGEDGVSDGRFALVAYWKASDAFRSLRFLIVSVLAAGGLGIVVAGGVSMVLARRFTDRTRLLVEATTRLADGDLGHRVIEGRPDEFGALARSFNTMTGRIQEARGRTEAAMAEWRSLVEHAPVMIVSVAPDETVRFVNRGLPGFDVDDVVGTQVSEWIDPQHRAGVLEVLRDVLRTGRSGHLEGAVVGNQDGPAWYAFRIGPVIRDGEVVGANLIATDITEKRKLQQDILDVAEAERGRVGRDLHDDLGQVLTGIALLSKSLEERLRAAAPSEAPSAGELHDLVRGAIEKTRRLARGLYPVAIEREGLDVALRDLADGAEDAANITCTVSGEIPSDWSADPFRASHLFRIVQESLTNAVKYGKPHRIEIRIDRHDDEWTLSVADDGVGIVDPLPEGKGLGLRLMRYRTEVVGGRFKIERGPGRGTIVTCRFSVPPNG